MNNTNNWISLIQGIEEIKSKNRDSLTTEQICILENCILTLQKAKNQKGTNQNARMKVILLEVLIELLKILLLPDFAEWIKEMIKSLNELM